MLSEIKDLQRNKVTQILHCLKRDEKFPKKITFQSPTGSGKTFMMMDLMNRILAKDKRVIFLVSSLSTSSLAVQVCHNFYKYRSQYPNIACDARPIEVTHPQNSPRINDHNFNVFVLPTDKYKAGANLKEGANGDILQNFLINKTKLNYRIYVIRDESHRQTKNLNSLERFFSVIFNFSATPKSVPDVKLDSKEAIGHWLIRDVTISNDELDDFGISKIIELSNRYRGLLPINPCLIIQISNSEKGNEEWAQIKTIFEQNPTLQWASIVPSSPNLCESNSEVLLKINKKDWSKELRNSLCPVSVIIFKLVIKEGYDIPRACMLYQSRAFRRESKGSDTLDQQVLGRICRNPILLDWENYSEAAQTLALQAYAWGKIDREHRSKLDVTLKTDQRFKFTIMTTHINNLWNHYLKVFNLSDFLKDKTKSNESIFELNKQWDKIIKDDASIKCLKNMIKSDDEWFLTCSNLKAIKEANEVYLNNYDQSIEVDENEAFLAKSSFWLGKNELTIDDYYWPWQRYDGKHIFDFDSGCEGEFFETIREQFKNKQGELEIFGKNLYMNDCHKAVKYGYVNDGPKFSYPDFILRIKGKIFIVEVKSKIKNSQVDGFDWNEYNRKITLLLCSYCATSNKIPDYVFMLAIKSEEGWKLYQFVRGEKREINGITYENFLT